MKQVPIPKNEKERLVSLHKLGLLDTPAEERFDKITRTATKIFHVPISALTLVDLNREWFKSCQGLSKHEGDRAVSFCGHALMSTDILVVTDMKKDKRFADNPMVIGEPYLRFYAGVPLMSRDGQRVGVFCVKDVKPREFSKEDEEILKGLASWAEIEVNSRNLGLSLNQERKLRSELRTQTRKLKLAHALMESEKAQYRAILASVGDGMIAVDKNVRVIFMNETAEKLVGWKNEEVIGRSWFEVIPMEDEKGNAIPDNKRPLKLAITRMKSVATTAITPNSYYFVKKNKTRFPVAVTTTPIILNGRVTGAIGVYRDITNELRVDKAKSEFVSLASHQLRTPLSAIKWYSEMLLNKDVGQLTEKQQEYLQEIHEGNERILSLVNSLLNVSRIEMGTFAVMPKRINIIKICKEILDEVHKDVINKRLQLIEKYAKISDIVVDPNLISIILQNLIENAIIYTPEKGKITISISQDPTSLLISVKDTGYGIPEKAKNKIFTKLFRADNVAAKEINGTGLGLYITKAIVEHVAGGKIWFESQENKGTTFFVSLPLSGMIKREGAKGLVHST